MEQSSIATAEERTAPAPDSASRSVYRGIMRALETHQLVPGQRLVETDLAVHYGVGRNAVREALQWLAARGAVSAIRHRSSAIRRLDAGETLEVLDVAEAMIVLTARDAAARFVDAVHGTRLAEALAELVAVADGEPGDFDRARRHLFAALLAIGGNRELERLFPAVALHILFAQYRGAGLRRHRLDDFRAIGEAVAAGDGDAAAAAVRGYVAALREAVRAAPAG